MALQCSKLFKGNGVCSVVYISVNYKETLKSCNTHPSSIETTAYYLKFNENRNNRVTLHYGTCLGCKVRHSFTRWRNPANTLTISSCCHIVRDAGQTVNQHCFYVPGRRSTCLLWIDDMIHQVAPVLLHMYQISWFIVWLSPARGHNLV